MGSKMCEYNSVVILFHCIYTHIKNVGSKMCVYKVLIMLLM